MIVKKATKNFEKTEWFKSISAEENKDLYDWIRGSIIPYLERKEKKEIN